MKGLALKISSMSKSVWEYICMRKCCFLPVGTRRGYQTSRAELRGASKLPGMGNGKQSLVPLHDWYSLFILKTPLWIPTALNFLSLVFIYIMYYNHSHPYYPFCLSPSSLDSMLPNMLSSNVCVCECMSSAGNYICCLWPQQPRHTQQRLSQRSSVPFHLSLSASFWVLFCNTCWALKGVM